MNEQHGVITSAMVHARKHSPRSKWQLLLSIAFGMFAGCVASGCGSMHQGATPSVVPTASATGAPTAVSPLTSSPEQQRTFLWSVSSSSAIVYLLGSVHVASQDVYPLDTRIESAFDRAETLVLEIPMDQMSQLQVAQKLASAGTYPAGDSIDKHVNGEVLHSLQEQLARSGSSLDGLRSFRPWLVAILLTLGEMQKQGYGADLGIDLYFAQKVRDRKRVLALETVDEQVALFAGMSEGLQEQMLRETLTKLGELGEDMRRALLLWRTGDAKAMDELLVAPLSRDYPDLYQSLFVERNRKMTAAIKGYLKTTGKYLVIVGAGHLVGPEGILQLLQGEGYPPVQE
jgi:uncharacterized protein